LGYSIARHNGKLIKSVKNVNIGEDVDVQVSDGSIQSKVKNINNKDIDK
jgi:exodeoxyribonuclease VII large subunit